MPRDSQPKVLVFGTGVFIRGFFGPMLQRMNDHADFGGSGIVVKLTPGPVADAYTDGAPPYAVVRRGLDDRGGSTEEWTTVDALDRFVNPYTDWDAFLSTARLPSMGYVVSNATEAGYADDGAPRPDGCPATFSGKLCAWLHARFDSLGGASASGVVVLPFELLEGNAMRLRALVIDVARRWQLGGAFEAWLEDHCQFLATLVDGIVAKPGVDDRALASARGDGHPGLLCVAEPYSSFIIQGPEAMEAELPLRSSGNDVTWTDDLVPWCRRKVRVLNGAHTGIVFLAMQAGLRLVRECCEDEVVGAFLNRIVNDEIVPALNGDHIGSYAADILGRFRNPCLDHALADIALNSAAKLQTRILPTISDHLEMTGELPRGLVLSVAAFMVHRPRGHGSDRKPVEDACRGIPGLDAAVSDAVRTLQAVDARTAMKEVLS
ncbi:MAG: hypothetical protein CMJ83_00155 [Planctomycetes bacterium]|nr:hypothetical protein [Planctomycetota bacterium]